jgi:hypothetical protein
VAALDIGNNELALSLVQNVHRAFPEGARASRLTVGGAGRCLVLALHIFQAPLVCLLPTSPRQCTGIIAPQCKDTTPCRYS